MRYAVLRRYGISRMMTLAALLPIFVWPVAAVSKSLDSKASELPRLTLTRQIRELKPDAAKLGYPVHLRAVVTYYGGLGWELFIQDASAGIYVDSTAQDWGLKAGDLIELDGSVAPGDYAPEVTNVRIRVVGRAPLPPAERVTLARLLTGKEDGQWVEVDGVVRSVIPQTPHTTLELGTAAGPLRVELPYTDLNVDHLVDSEVRVSGACGTIFNKKRQLVGVQLFVPGIEQISVLKPALDDPYSIPVRPIDTLLQFAPEGPSSHRIRVQGIVTLQRFGYSLFIEDETQGLLVATSQPTPLKVGDFVDVLGFPSVGEYTPVLEHAVFRRIASGVVPKPRKMTPRQALQGDLDAELVEIEAEVKDQVIRSGEQTLIMIADNLLFEAQKDAARTGLNWPVVPNNSRVSLTGICSVQVGEDRVPRSFRILLRSPGDIRVLQAPSWWTVGRALYFLGFIGLIAFVASGWVIILRQQVREKTGIIRRQLEHEVALEKRFQYVARATNDAVWDLDLKTQTIWWNDSVETIFGYRADTIDPSIEWWRERLHPDDCGRVVKSLEESTHSDRENWSEEYRFRRSDGTYAYVYDRGYVIRDEGGNSTRMIGAMMDITGHKRAEEALQRAKEAAESANKAKSAFLANMSHEIRTPMNGIIGMTELVLDTPLTPDQRDYVETVKTSAASLLSILNDILDFSKIEAGKLDLDPVPFSLRDMLGATLNVLAVRADQKKLELACNILTTVPDSLVGDPDRLRQVVLNLVGNAIKFTEKGEVVVHVDSEFSSGDGVLLHFLVSDTGIGIPPEKQKSIFHAFEQADGSMTRRYGGTGLGLTISARLVELMGGRIWVESERGMGSSFHFTACLKLAEQAALRQDAPQSLEGLRVLVADDNEVSRRILQAMLVNWNLEPKLAVDGPSALALLADASQSGEPFDLAILDCMMPDMDGCELTAKIRENRELERMPIILLTSASSSAVLRRSREAGVTAYLKKPVVQSELLSTIKRVLGVKVEPRRDLRPVPHSEKATGGLRILIAEDNPINQRIAIRLLEKRGHKPAAKSNGREALDALEQEEFDLALMDVQMPDMDGFEATAAIRKREEGTGRRIPIIAMTAHTMKGDRERCLAAGMDGYLAKPIDPQLLYETIEGFSRTVAARELEKSRETGCGEVMDYNEVMTRFAGDGEFLLTSLELLRSRHAGWIAQIRRSLAEGDFRTAERAAHSLKGAVGNFGGRTAMDTARKLESLARERDAVGAEGTCDRLAREIELLINAASEFAQELKNGRGFESENLACRR